MPFPKITFRVAEITPADAAHLAQNFLSTGKVDPKRIRTFADDMGAGRWLLNGSPLVLSWQGLVLDGRARLLACIESGTPFQTLVVEGVDPDTFETIDALRRRTLADVLTIRNYQHGRALGAALRIIWAYQSNGIGSAKAPSSVALLDLIETHPDIRDHVMPSLRNSPWLPHSSGIALHYLFSLVDARKTDAFFNELAQPSLAARGSPSSLLRKILDDTRPQGGRRQTHLLAVAIKAWNAYAAGEELKFLRYTPDREAFPHIAGLKPSGPAAGGDTPLFEGMAKGGAAPPVRLDARVETITPEMAAEMLEANGLNRRISGGVVEKYARDMIDGRWRLNGQTIKLSTAGRLLDGQHRLEACKKARVSFTAVIVSGIAEEAFSSLDTGQRRSLADVLRDRGETNTIAFASALRWLWMYKHDIVLAANTSPTNGEMLELLEQNPTIRSSYRFSALVKDFLGSGTAWALHYIFSQRDAALADEFFERLSDGAELAKDNPIYRLRERLRRIRASHRIRKTESERMVLAAKAWNACREDRAMQQLSWRNRGPTREGFPALV